MVDATDLKSVIYIRCGGSNPPLGIITIIKYIYKNNYNKIQISLDKSKKSLYYKEKAQYD